MLAAPLVIRREDQGPADETADGVGARMPEEGAVAAVVENDEDAHQQARSDHDQRRKQPPGDGQAEVHQQPQQRIGAERAAELPAGLEQIGPLIGLHGFVENGGPG